MQKIAGTLGLLAHRKFGDASATDRLTDEEVNAELSKIHYGAGERIWDYGNIYGSNKLKGVGDTFWFLDKDKKIITWPVNWKYKIYMKRGQVMAPTSSLDDPKENAVRRATFMFYIPGISSTNPPEYPNCTVDIHVNKIGTSSPLSRAGPSTCPYHYCLVNYSLNADNTVKDVDIIKCALGRP